MIEIKRNYEKWLLLPGVKDLAISNYGRILSFRTTSFGKLRSSKNKRYPMITIDNKAIVIHQKVMELFGPIKPAKGYEINHKDGNRNNPKIWNLEWVTHLENVRHAWDILKIEIRGSNHGFSKLDEETVKIIRFLHSTGRYTYPILSKAFEVSEITIGRIIRRQYWTHI